MSNAIIKKLTSALKTLNINQTAAEFHGYLCGHIVLNNHNLDEWLLELIDEHTLKVTTDATNDNNIAKEAILFLTKITNDNIKYLDNQNFNFELILLDENFPLKQRLKSFIQWCDSFLYAFGLSINNATKLGFKFDETSEIGEIIRDINEFTKINCQLDNEGTDNDLALMELIEYIKVGLLLIYTEVKLKTSK